MAWRPSPSYLNALISQVLTADFIDTDPIISTVLEELATILTLLFVEQPDEPEEYAFWVWHTLLDPFDLLEDDWSRLAMISWPWVTIPCWAIDLYVDPIYVVSLNLQLSVIFGDPLDPIYESFKFFNFESYSWFCIIKIFFFWAICTAVWLGWTPWSLD